MGSWGVKALESDNGLDLIFLLKTDYLPKHKKLTLGGLIGFLKEEGFLGETVNEIDFLYDNTAIAIAELYSEWQKTGKLNYDDEDSNVWSAITNFSASAIAIFWTPIRDQDVQLRDDGKKVQIRRYIDEPVCVVGIGGDGDINMNVRTRILSHVYFSVHITQKAIQGRNIKFTDI